MKEIGVSGRLHEWTNHWLRKKKQRIEMNEVTSEWMPVTSGVPKALSYVSFSSSFTSTKLTLVSIISLVNLRTTQKSTNSVLSECDRQNLHEDLRKISD